MHEKYVIKGKKNNALIFYLKLFSKSNRLTSIQIYTDRRTNYLNMGERGGGGGGICVKNFNIFYDTRSFEDIV